VGDLRFGIGSQKKATQTAAQLHAPRSIDEPNNPIGSHEHFYRAQQRHGGIAGVRAIVTFATGSTSTEYTAAFMMG
jgi:hypothetical protein